MKSFTMTELDAPVMPTQDGIYAALHTLLAAIRCAPTNELAQEAATMAVCLGAQALQDISGRLHTRSVLEVVIDQLNSPGRMLPVSTTH